MRHKMGNQSVIEAFCHNKVGRNERLERIDEVVDWNEIAKLVENIYSARDARPVIHR